MQKTSKSLSEEMERLIDENTSLRQQLQKAGESIGAGKTRNVDAFVIGNKNDRKVFTDATSDKIYRVLIEKMSEGAVILNQDSVILYCNSYFSKMMNVPLEKTTGKKIMQFIDDPSKERFEILVKQGNENPAKGEIHLNVKDGHAIPVLISVNSLLLDNNPVLCIIVTDLTIQNKYKKELEQINIELESANKDLTSFTYVSSHDLQEPLRKIQNFVSCIMVDEEKNLSETGKYYFQRMRQSAKRMQTLINDLLTYSQTKSSERNFEDTDLGIIIEDVKKEYEPSMLDKSLIIEAVNLCHVNIIRYQFQQLFQNLISNSVKFSKPQTATHITIQSEIVLGNDAGGGKLSPKTNYCHITYTDNGIGFDSRYNDYIFDVFKRLHSKEEYEGTGIGLAICKRVVENHNGIIVAAGELNKGARFDIYIPASL